MFTRKEKNMLFDPYFEVIRETEQFIEVRSVNTGHCWSVFKNIYNAPRKITLYHKHKESDRYFHQHRVYRTVVDAVSEIKSHDKYVLEEKTKQRESPAQTERRLKVHESSGYKYKPSLVRLHGKQHLWRRSCFQNRRVVHREHRIRPAEEAADAIHFL